MKLELFCAAAAEELLQRQRWERIANRQDELETVMQEKFKTGDHVTWNSEAGHVSGTVIKVHTEDTNYKGYTHHASADDPQYGIRSDKSDHIAMHKGHALKKMIS